MLFVLVDHDTKLCASMMIDRIEFRPTKQPIDLQHKAGLRSAQLQLQPSCLQGQLTALYRKLHMHPNTLGLPLHTMHLIMLTSKSGQDLT